MTTSSEPQYCINHPTTETTLRCNRCEKPVCPKCVTLIETGYRCKDCVRGRLKVFENAEWYDYPLAFIVAAILSYIGGLISASFGFFVIMIAPIAGGIIAEAVRAVVRRRRAKYLFILATVGTVLGALVVLYDPIIWLLLGYPFSLTRILWPGVYIVMATSTVYYRLAGISI